MSFGFDFDGCQQAVAEGNSTVETAVEWQVMFFTVCLYKTFPKEKGVRVYL